jgi:hypothetical protein
MQAGHNDQRKPDQPYPPDVEVQPIGDVHLPQVCGHVLLAAGKGHDVVHAKHLGYDEHQDADEEEQGAHGWKASEHGLLGARRCVDRSKAGASQPHYLRSPFTDTLVQ